MNKVLVSVLSLLLMMVSVDAMASGYTHQIEASFNLDQREFDLDSGGEIERDIFALLGTYRNQVKNKIYIVGNLEFSNGAEDYIAFSGGLEMNMIRSGGQLEAGFGGWLRLFTGDIDGFGIRPYGFIRSFFSNRIFISSTLSYDWAKVDFGNQDADFMGIQIYAGLGYAF